PPGVIDGVIGMYITSSEWIATWNPKRLLESISRASIPAQNTTTRICQVPEPSSPRANSPSITPSSTPQDISTILRIFFSMPNPMMMNATIAEKNGNSRSQTIPLTRYARLAATAARATVSASPRPRERPSWSQSRTAPRARSVTGMALVGVGEEPVGAGRLVLMPAPDRAAASRAAPRGGRCPRHGRRVPRSAERSPVRGSRPAAWRAGRRRRASRSSAPRGPRRGSGPSRGTSPSARCGSCRRRGRGAPAAAPARSRPARTGPRRHVSVRWPARAPPRGPRAVRAPSSRTPPDDAVPSPPGHRLLSYPPLFQLAGDRTAETAEQCRAGSVRTPWRRAPAERSELGGGGPGAVVAGQHDRLLRGVEPERPALAVALPEMDLHRQRRIDRHRTAHHGQRDRPQIGVDRGGGDGADDLPLGV